MGKSNKLLGADHMLHVAREKLEPLARKYVWWKTPDEAVSMPERVIAQVMDVGDFEDARRARRR
jgi:hypothetical protein